MRTAPTVTPAILEALYEEALCLTEAARAEFSMTRTTHTPLRAVRNAGGPAAVSDKRTSERMALSCEALRTTTRLMHAMAWLLNFRAYFNGELDAFQLRRFGRLPAAQPASSAEELAALSAPARAVVEASCIFYARLARLDRAFYRDEETASPTLEHLHSRIGRAFAAG
ncbi:DUF1465 family protein [Aurantiacibacter xanthus]|uniref:DUF1465 family protein n=1 Tax=Aurantiacibacter xanthus TaxID=1784712 RepID=A0A3A1P062_9SPHN|nr:DUF1465 family protein [Aurantiacibacter xanthus]RIV80453.1 DUF1465 family protein [Aurantiacibacter xanthus]